MRELKRENIHLEKRDLESSLWVRCFPFHIERVLDNPLNNASNAIPEEGGELSVQSYRKDPWAVVEIINTGQIPEEEKHRFLSPDISGRGLDTVTRLVKHMGGKMEVESQERQSTFRVVLPTMNP
jgi:signal transduction histidine kinase